MPLTLGGVTVYVAGTRAPLYYVSPTQINLLIPSELTAKTVKVQVVRDGMAGPAVTVLLQETAPALFQLNTDTIVATHLDGSVVTTDAPAVPGEIVVLYAAGLGRLIPDRPSGEIATTIAWIAHKVDLAIVIGGVTVDNANVYYAGVAPGFAGLYQINLKLPSDAPSDPEIRLWILDQSSPFGLKIPVRGAAPAA